MDRVFADALEASEQRQLTRAAEQELDRLHEPMQDRTRQLPTQARELATDLKPKIRARDDTPFADAQLDYVGQLSPKTRGIESGQRK